MGTLELTLTADAGGFPVEATLQLGPGPFVLAGPSGAGKTTLLRLILGVLRPKSGLLRLGGTVLFDAAAGVDLPTEERAIGYVPQHYGLFPHLTALQNVRFALEARGLARGRGEASARALAALSQLDIAQLADRRPRALSGGERQRVALARALASEPKALLLDEPLAALDVSARRAVRELLARQLRTLGIPTLVVTHDPEDAAALGSQVAVMEEGRIVQQGSLAELARAPATPFVQALTTRSPGGAGPDGPLGSGP